MQSCFVWFVPRISSNIYSVLTFVLHAFRGYTIKIYACSFMLLVLAFTPQHDRYMATIIAFHSFSNRQTSNAHLMDACYILISWKNVHLRRWVACHKGGVGVEGRDGMRYHLVFTDMCEYRERMNSRSSDAEEWPHASLIVKLMKIVWLFAFWVFWVVGVFNMRTNASS